MSRKQPKGVCLWLPQWVTVHMCILTYGTPPCKTGCCFKKKKVHGTDWFPGPDMPVNMGRRSVLSCTGLPSLLGQQPWGPQPSCSPRHHAVESIVIPLQAQLFQKSRRPDTSKDISRPTPTFVPQAPQKVRSEGCRAGRRRPPPPSSPPCLAFPHFC